MVYVTDEGVGINCRKADKGWVEDRLLLDQSF